MSVERGVTAPGGAGRPMNVLILGANGQLARNTTRVCLRDTDARLTAT